MSRDLGDSSRIRARDATPILSASASRSMRQRDRVASLVIDTANQLTPGIKPGEPLAMWLGRSAAGIRHVLGLAKQHSSEASVCDGVAA